MKNSYTHPKIEICKIFSHFDHEIEISKIFLYSPKTEILAHFIEKFNFLYSLKTGILIQFYILLKKSKIYFRLIKAEIAKGIFYI